MGVAQTAGQGHHGWTPLFMVQWGLNTGYRKESHLSTSFTLPPEENQDSLESDTSDWAGTTEEPTG